MAPFRERLIGFLGLMVLFGVLLVVGSIVVALLSTSNA